jgi:hypothetical protein
MAERLATYDYAALGRLLRPRLEKDGRGWRACAEEIGVTASDLSRIVAGQAVAYPKVKAVGAWLGIDPDRFYAPGCFTGKALKRDSASRASGASPLRSGGASERSDGGRSAADGKGRAA